MFMDSIEELPVSSISLFLKLKTVKGSRGSLVTSIVRRKLVVTLLSLAVSVVSSFSLEKLSVSVQP